MVKKQCILAVITHKGCSEFHILYCMSNKVCPHGWQCNLLTTYSQVENDNLPPECVEVNAPFQFDYMHGYQVGKWR